MCLLKITTVCCVGEWTLHSRRLDVRVVCSLWGIDSQAQVALIGEVQQRPGAWICQMGAVVSGARSDGPQPGQQIEIVSKFWNSACTFYRFEALNGMRAT